MESNINEFIQLKNKEYSEKLERYKIYIEKYKQIIDFTSNDNIFDDYFDLFNSCENDIISIEANHSEIQQSIKFLQENHGSIEIGSLTNICYCFEKLLYHFVILKNNIEINFKSIQLDYFHENNQSLENERNKLLNINDDLKQKIKENLQNLQILQSQEKTQELKQNDDKHKLRMRMSIIIFSFLAIQFIGLGLFLVFYHKDFKSENLTYILLAIAGQSYFLPSFMAKYLFNNDGVQQQQSVSEEQSKDFKGFGFDFKWYK